MAFNVSYVYEIQDRYSRVINNITRNTNRFREATQRTMVGVNGFSASMRNAGRNVRDVGSGLVSKLTLPIQALGLASIRTSIQMESGFTGVRKTVNATEAQFKKMRSGFEEMSTQMPVSVKDLFKVGEAAGQLGIKTKNILGFSKVIAMLGVTTNMTGEEGATQLARLANITGMSQDKFDRLGSTIVHLGNNMATTEAEITTMGLRLAGAGNVVGMTEHQILALSATLSSVGINAEAGGTAFSRVMLNINDAVQSGGKMLNRFAKVSGMTSKEFAETFKKDAAKGILKFVEGLDRLKKEGVNVNKVLAGVNFKEIRVRDSLLRTSGASELLRNALEMGSKAWKENNALTKEAGLRFSTSESKLKILWNRVKLVSKTIGDILVPVLIKLLDKVVPIIEKFKGLSETTQKYILIAAGILSVIPPILIVLGGMIAAAGTLGPLITALGAALAFLFSPIGLLISGIGFLIFKLTTTKELINPIINQFKDLGRTILNESAIFTDFFSNMGGGIETADMFKIALKGVAAVIINVLKGVKMLVIGLRAVFQSVSMLPKLINAISSGDFSAVSGIIKEAASKNKESFSEIAEIGKSMMSPFASNNQYFNPRGARSAPGMTKAMIERGGLGGLVSEQSKFGDGINGKSRMDKFKSTQELRGLIKLSTPDNINVDEAYIDNNLGQNLMFATGN